MGKIDETSRKVCVSCSEEKPLSEFYKQSGKAESEIRWDRKCKVCKRRAINLARTKEPSFEATSDRRSHTRNLSPQSQLIMSSDGKAFLKNGQTYEFQKSDWANVVRIFQTLKRWRDERDTPKANTIEPERTWPNMCVGDINKAHNMNGNFGNE